MNQTVMSRNMIKLVKEATEKVEKEVDNILASTRNLSKAIGEEEKGRKLSDDLLALALMVATEIREYKTFQSKIFGSLAKKGPTPLDLDLVPLTEIKRIVEKIKTNLTNEELLVTDIQGVKETELLFRDIAMNVQMINDEVIFEIRIPTVEGRERTIYALRTVPIRISGEIYRLRTKSDYITVDSRLEEITYMSETDFQGCNVVAGDRFICKENDMIFLQRPLNKICELSLLTYKQIVELLDECKYDKLPETDVFTKLLLPNDFYFLVNGNRTMKLECDGVTREVILSGSGVVHLNRNCEMFDDEVIIKSHHLLNLREQYTNMQNIIIPVVRDYKLKEAKRRTIDGSTSELDKNIQQTRAQEVDLMLMGDKKKRQANKIITHPMFHSFIGLIVGLAAATAVWYKFRGTRWLRNEGRVQFINVPAPTNDIPANRSGISLSLNRS